MSSESELPASITYNRCESCFALMAEVFNRTGRFVLFVSVLVVTVALLAATGTAAAQSAPDCSTVEYDGDGTESNPYEVGDVDQLQCIEEHDLGANYVQVADIDASETEEWNGGDGFDPIGEADITSDTEFTGTFDGANHTISDLYIDRVSTNDVGLFGVVEIGRLENVSLENVDITGSSSVGGLVGLNDASGTVTESYAAGSVIGGQGVGGLVGYNDQSTVTESYATGSFYSAGYTVGGLVGINLDGTVENSYANGSVNGDKNVGSLVGHNYLGGTVRKSYATGNVSGDSGVGGLVGLNNEDSTVMESYWNEETTGQPTSAGGTGLTTAEMTGSAARGNMTAFDFTSTWKTVPNAYPVLSWEDVSRGERNEVDGNESSDGSNDGENGTSSDDGAGGEGLPGFTAVTAVLALLTVVAATVRRRME